MSDAPLIRPLYRNEFSVVDVMQARKVPTTNRAAVLIGREAGRLWREMTHVPPAKELRQKTNGKGTHKLAVYPNFFRKRVEEIVDRYHHQMMNHEQPDLFSLES